jgi:ABC-type multidrug transport system ATPase subunit
MIADKVGIIFEGQILKEGSLNDLISESVHYFELVFTGMDEEKISTLNLDAFKQDRNFMIRCMDEDEVNSVIGLILNGDGKIVSVTPIKKNLEEIFLEEIKE